MDEGKRPQKGRGVRSAGALGALTIGILFGVPLYIYSRTLSPTVNLIDSGELMSVAVYLGIAHPTGYPLYTLLGRLVALIQASNPAVSLNFLSAIFGSAAVPVGWIAFLATECRDNHDGSVRSVWPRPSVAVVSGLLFALSRTMWQVSTQTEVYSLAVLLIALLLANYPERPVYVDFDDDPRTAPALKKDPQGVIFQLREAFAGESYDISGYRLTSTLDSTIYRDERSRWIRSLYAWYAVKKGVILRDMESHEEAVESLENAV